MIDRRKFIGVSATAGMGAILPVKLENVADALAGNASADASAARWIPTSPKLSMFTETLPIPPAYTPTDVGGVDYYEIPISQFTQQLHASLPPTPVWGYGGTFPSRSIEATRGRPVRVKWINTLPTSPHLLPVDTVNVMGANNGEPLVRIVTHLHGGHVPWTSDGGPEGWYTSGLLPVTGAKFNGDTFEYPNIQPGTTLWFHDHALGITRLNVYAGMAGFYILRDPAEAALNLPSGAYEIPIVFQDRTFNKNGTLYYPPPPEVPEFFGDTMVVNGKVWPRLVVEPRKYRFRLLNGCNSRFLRMRLLQAMPNGALMLNNFKKVMPGPMFNQIGSDGGLLPAVATTQILLQAPAERCDVIIDFTGLAGQHFQLYNDAATPFSNTAGTRGAIPEVMLFSVTAPLSGTDTSVIPASLPAFPRLDPATANRSRDLTLDEIMTPTKMLMQLINNTPYAAPSTENPVLGTTEIWNLLNLTVDTHPIHTHQTMFQVLDRTPFNAVQYAADRAAGTLQPLATYLLGPAVAPDPNEMGWKDTVRANPNEMTRIIMKWENFAGDYVYHCHILEHEEHDMMRPLIVQPAPVV